MSLMRPSTTSYPTLSSPPPLPLFPQRKFHSLEPREPSYHNSDPVSAANLTATRTDLTALYLIYAHHANLPHTTFPTSLYVHLNLPTSQSVTSGTSPQRPLTSFNSNTFTTSSPHRHHVIPSPQIITSSHPLISSHHPIPSYHISHNLTLNMLYSVKLPG